MAETKTNIPAKIKMGTAGSNDSNLPTFEEGSVVFTTDTKKIYIDAPGMTERIAVGGTEVDLSGKQDKFANITNPGICKIEMSNSGQTYFCNYASDSGIYFDSSIRLLQGKGIKNEDDLVNKAYVDTKQVKFADYSETTDGIIYKNLTLGNNEALVIRGQNDNLAKITLEPSVININSNQININPITRFTMGNFLEMAASDEGDIFVFSIGGSSNTIGQIHFTGSNRFGTSGITLQGNIENVATTSLNVNKNNIKLISWAYGNNTNNAPLLGVSTPVEAADTTKGITADDLDYQAVNKKYVDDNSGAGKKFGTSEVFNDYENNAVWSENYDGGLLVTDLSDTVVTLENVEGLAVGGTFNIYSLTHDYTSGNLTITAINTSTNKVTFSGEYAGPPLTVAILYVVNSTATKTTKLFYKYAHAEGYQTKAQNNYSHAEGIGTVAGVNTGVSYEGIAQTAVGMYNTINPYLFFMVGNGTAANARSNAFEVYKDGHATVQKMGTTDNSVVIKSELDKKQNDLKITLDSSNHNIQLSSSYNTFLLNKGTLGSVGNINFSPSGNQQINYCKYICNEAVGQSGSTMITLGDGKVSFTNYAGNETIRLTNVATPVDNTDAVNKKYVDDIKAELLEAITHPYTYDETTKELTLIL